MIKLLSQNIIIYGFTNALKSLVPVLMLPILTRYLSVGEYGMLSLIETNILFITPFIILSINSAINVEYHKLDREILKNYITNAISVSVFSFFIISLFFLVFNDKLSYLLGLDNNIVIFLTTFVLLRLIITVTLGLLQISQKSVQFASYTISQTLVDFGLSFLFVVYYKNGYIGRLEGVYGSFFIFSIIGIIYLVKNDYVGKFNLNHTRDILIFCIPLIPHALGGTIIAMSDRYFIAHFYGAEDVGLYTISYQMSAILLLITMSINQAWTPIAFKLLNRKDIKKYKQLSIFLMVLFLIFSTGVYFLKDVIFSVFVDDKFFKAKGYFGFLLLGFLFQSLYFISTNSLFFFKKTKVLAIITFLGSILNLILNYFFILKYGILGVAYSTAVTWFLFFFCVLITGLIILNKFGDKNV
ncbi:lipopolysaccharide biosynthesis protein [Photobacterium leiognathi]|uniref:lipopolysaccharide biosynthesis protein n=1 Tax=Photobacterium leiognathi TaxID=553611 RepID=UPI00273894A9|nr:oligosaccharide flippase family protein [Photobacterium leiognathi]